MLVWHYHNTEIIDTSYEIYRQDRQNKGGGGVLILVKSEYFSEERKELVSMNIIANEIHVQDYPQRSAENLKSVGGSSLFKIVTLSLNMNV